MSITICINQLDTAKQESLVRISEKEAHGNAKLLKALYEESPAAVRPKTTGELGSILAEQIEKQETESTSVARQQRRVKAVRALPTIEEAFRFEDHGHVDVSNDAATYYINFQIDKGILAKTEFFVRFGSYDDIPENWEDVEVSKENIINFEEGRYYIKLPLPSLRRGWYGATCYAADKRTAKVIWQGTGFAQDAKFRINIDSLALVQKHYFDRNQHFASGVEKVLLNMGSYESFESSVAALHENGCRKDLPKILFEATKGNEQLRETLSSYFQEAVARLSSVKDDSELNARAKVVATALSNLGVGEIVLVAPEGPQATFGGLAQVMEGFLKAFPKVGIQVTLISLLYEYAQGNRHTDAASTLRQGLKVGDDLLRLKYAGEVDVPFGPTHRVNTTHCAQQGHSARANVYVAQKDNVKVVLLRHNRFSDRLYPRLFGDEQLRRAIFLCRGALEVMKNPTFGIRAQLILSNDWVSALVPVFLKLDQRYNDNDLLRNARTIHIIHNCGRDYHGRFPNQHQGQSLFPMLELNPVHWEGLMDPQQKGFFNLTAAAVHHLNGAVLAVSKPYAESLLTNEGSDGLAHLMWQQKEALFGVSNGVDQAHLRSTVSRIGEGAREDIGWGRTKENPNDLSNFFEQLLSYKEAAKLRLQRNFGLHQDANHTIISLVGRLAEQKGIQLLMANGAGDGCSVLELILRRYPNVQLVIAGPRVDGDDMSSRFCSLVDHLRRCFGGRVVGIFDFVPHDFAMEVFAASDFTLMPSRFEPGGLTQLEALAAGSLVIARNVGGISATLERFDDASGKGNGFMFDEYTSTALRNTICWALDRTGSADFRKELMLEAARAEHDWSHRVPQYLSVFQHIAGALADCNSYKHLEKRREYLNGARA